MGLFAPKPAPAPVAQPAPLAAEVKTVDIRINPADGSRVVTIIIPKPKEYTEEDLARIEQEKGKRPLAVCDLTGELIFNDLNVNKVISKRPELNNKVLSTKLIKQLLGIAEEKAANV